MYRQPVGNSAGKGKKTGIQHQGLELGIGLFIKKDPGNYSLRVVLKGDSSKYFLCRLKPGRRILPRAFQAIKHSSEIIYLILEYLAGNIGTYSDRPCSQNSCQYRKVLSKRDVNQHIRIYSLAV